MVATLSSWPGTKVDWRIKKVWRRAAIGAYAVTQVVVIRAGDVNSDDVTTVISARNGGNITDAPFGLPGEPPALCQSATSPIREKLR